MKNAESTMAGFYKCCLVEENKVFAETLLGSFNICAKTFFKHR